MAKIKWDQAPEPIRWNKLKALRKVKGLSQPQVAVGAGVSITSVYYLELGYEERTTAKTKEKLAKFFECDVEDIFPCEMIGNEPREKFLDEIRKGNGRPILK
jgi:DNA-binding XRE family transcriptional regulator